MLRFRVFLFVLVSCVSMKAVPDGGATSPETLSYRAAARVIQEFEWNNGDLMDARKRRLIYLFAHCPPVVWRWHNGLQKRYVQRLTQRIGRIWAGLKVARNGLSREVANSEIAADLFKELHFLSAEFMLSEAASAQPPGSSIVLAMGTFRINQTEVIRGVYSTRLQNEARRFVAADLASARERADRDGIRYLTTIGSHPTLSVWYFLSKAMNRVTSRVFPRIPSLSIPESLDPYWGEEPLRSFRRAQAIFADLQRRTNVERQRRRDELAEHPGERPNTREAAASVVQDFEWSDESILDPRKRRLIYLFARCQPIGWSPAYRTSRAFLRGYTFYIGLVWHGLKVAHNALPENIANLAVSRELYEELHFAFAELALSKREFLYLPEPLQNNLRRDIFPFRNNETELRSGVYSDRLKNEARQFVASHLALARERGDRDGTRYLTTIGSHPTLSVWYFYSKAINRATSRVFPRIPHIGSVRTIEMERVLDDLNEHERDLRERR